MTNQRDIEVYNYSVFEGQEDFTGFRSLLQIGVRAPDFPATLLETGETVKLSDYWRERDLVIEFGSHT